MSSADLVYLLARSPSPAEDLEWLVNRLPEIRRMYEDARLRHEAAATGRKKPRDGKARGRRPHATTEQILRARDAVLANSKNAHLEGPKYRSVLADRVADQLGRGDKGKDRILRVLRGKERRTARRRVTWDKLVKLYPYMRRMPRRVRPLCIRIAEESAAWPPWPLDPLFSRVPQETV